MSFTSGDVVTLITLGVVILVVFCATLIVFTICATVERCRNLENSVRHSDNKVKKDHDCYQFILKVIDDSLDWNAPFEKDVAEWIKRRLSE